MRAGLNSHAGRARVGPALALALLLTACASAPEPQPRAFSNPVLDRDFPDPAVLRSPDGWIYAYATQGAAGGAGTSCIPRPSPTRRPADAWPSRPPPPRRGPS